MVKAITRLDRAPDRRKRRPLGKDIADQNKLRRKYDTETVSRTWQAMLLVHVLGYWSTTQEQNREVAERVEIAVDAVKYIRDYYSPAGCYSRDIL